MHVDNYVRSKIAEFGWRAAHHISVPAILAVMFVVKNRVGDTNDWLRALYEIRNTVIDLEPIDIREPYFLEALRLADGIYPGDTGETPRKDIYTSGALYWWDGNWQPFDLTGKERVSQVGTLTLWK